MRLVIGAGPVVGDRFDFAPYDLNDLPGIRALCERGFRFVTAHRRRRDGGECDPDFRWREPLACGR